MLPNMIIQNDAQILDQGFFLWFGSFQKGRGGDFFVMKIIRETTEIKVFFSKLIKLSMKFGSL
jgi:hypothetical protein